MAESTACALAQGKDPEKSFENPRETDTQCKPDRGSEHDLDEESLQSRSLLDDSEMCDADRISKETGRENNTDHLMNIPEGGLDVVTELKHHRWLSWLLKFLGWRPGHMFTAWSFCFLLLNVLFCLPAIALRLLSHVKDVDFWKKLTTGTSYENDGTVIALVLVTLIHAAPLVTYCFALDMFYKKNVLGLAFEIIHDGIKADDATRDEQDVSKECGKYTSNLLKRVFPWAALYLLVYVVLVLADTCTESIEDPENPLSFINVSCALNQTNDAGNFVPLILYTCVDSYPFLLVTLVSLLYYVILHSYEFRLRKFPQRMQVLTDRPEQVTREFHAITRDENRVELFRCVSQFLLISLSLGFALPAVYAHFHFALRQDSSHDWLFSLVKVVKVVVGFLSPWIFILLASLRISDAYKAIAEKARTIQITLTPPATGESEEAHDERHQARWSMVTDYITSGPFTGFHVTWMDMVVNRSQALLFVQAFFAALLWAAFSSLNDYRVHQDMMAELTSACTKY